MSLLKTLPSEDVRNFALLYESDILTLDEVRNLAGLPKAATGGDLFRSQYLATLRDTSWGHQG